jgi:pimeloyl-ACP methyl ester carboxylesterase
MAGESATSALAEALANDTLTLSSGAGQVAVLRPENLCAALFDARGRALLTTPGWVAAGLRPDLELLAATPVGQPVVAGDAEDDEQLPPLFMRADIAAARDWALPPGLAAGLNLPGAAMLVVAVLPVAAGAVLRASGRALGLTDLQCRVLEAVLKTGSIRSAAVAAGIAYDTARAAVSDGMARVGVPRLPALLDRLVMLALGVWPDEGPGNAALVADMLGLSERQGRLALALALGLTRAEAAAATGLSAAVAKKEIDQLFIVAGVGSAAALVRRLGEARALAMLAGVAGGGAVWAEEGMAPLRLVTRPDGSRIAVSDYGPAGAPPLLVLHSSMTTRHVARPLLRSLQHAGWRVLAIDRPGYGLSDMVAGPCPFAAAAADLLTVLDALKLPRVAVVARGAAQVALAAARQAPARLGPVVLVNPDPPSELSGEGVGILAAIKSVLWNNPALVAGFARLLASQYAPAKAETIIRRTVEASPPDRAFMDDPRNVADYYRATRSFVTGRVAGYVAEQQAFATMAADAPLPGTRDWTVLLGEVDVIHDPALTAAYWRDVLPDAAHVTVPGAGRFLAMTHGAQLVAALSRASAGKI